MSLREIIVRSTELAPFGALRLVRFEPDFQSESVHLDMRDHAKRMGWTEIAPHLYAPTRAMYGCYAAGTPYSLPREETWHVDA